MQCDQIGRFWVPILFQKLPKYLATFRAIVTKMCTDLQKLFRTKWLSLFLIAFNFKHGCWSFRRSMESYFDQKHEQTKSFMNPWKVRVHFCLRPTAEGPGNYLSCSCSGHFINLLLGCTSGYTSGVNFWFKSVRIPRTSPGRVWLRST